MVTIRIGESQRDFTKVEESWINKEINGRQKDETPVCVQVIINEGNLNFTYSQRIATVDLEAEDH